MKKDSSEYKSQGANINNPNEDIKVSVIMPFYNESAHIAECLESIVAQSLKEIEIICIDDGSTDNSAEIVKKFAGRDGRITLLSQDNQGSGVARNYGMTIARGEYVCFIDADDWYPENTVLNNLYSTAKDNNVKICGGSFSSYDDGEIITEYQGDLSKYTFEKNGKIKFKDYQFAYGYHRFIYDRAMLQKAGIKFPEYLRFQDPPFMATAMVKAKKFYGISQVVYRYREDRSKLAWTDRKVKDLLSGINDILILSREKNYASLHYYALMKINEDFYDVIMEELAKDNSEVIQLLLKACENVNINLIKEINPEYVTGDCVIKPLCSLVGCYKKNEEISKTLSISEEKVSELIKENEELKSEKKQETEEKAKLIEEYKKQNEKLNYELTETRKSATYKIGRMITWLPRKIKGAKRENTR